MHTHLLKFSHVTDPAPAVLPDLAANDPLAVEPPSPAPPASLASRQDEYELGGYAGI